MGSCGGRGLITLRAETADNRAGLRPGLVRNKSKRRELHKQQQSQKKKDQRAGRNKRKKEREQAELAGHKVVAPVTRTLENTREFDETVVAPDDEEVAADQDTDGESRPSTSQDTAFSTHSQPTVSMLSHLDSH